MHTTDGIHMPINSFITVKLQYTSFIMTSSKFHVCLFVILKRLCNISPYVIFINYANYS